MGGGVGKMGGGGYSATILQLKSQSAKISDNFHFRGGGGGILYCRIGVFCRIWTTYVETKQGAFGEFSAFWSPIMSLHFARSIKTKTG